MVVKSDTVLAGNGGATRFGRVVKRHGAQGSSYNNCIRGCASVVEYIARVPAEIWSIGRIINDTSADKIKSAARSVKRERIGRRTGVKLNRADRNRRRNCHARRSGAREFRRCIRNDAARPVRPSSPRGSWPRPCCAYHCFSIPMSQSGGRYLKPHSDCTSTSRHSWGRAAVSHREPFSQRLASSEFPPEQSSAGVLLRRTSCRAPAVRPRCPADPL